jgi:hypothetical protein
LNSIESDAALLVFKGTQRDGADRQHESFQERLRSRSFDRGPLAPVVLRGRAHPIPKKSAGFQRVKILTEVSNSEIAAPDNVWVLAAAK